MFRPSLVWNFRWALLLLPFLMGQQVIAQSIISPPDRRADEGAGPFETLLIKNAILIDGTGAPPIGPVNIVVKQNRIESIGSGIVADADHVIDATGMYVLPGFIDMHAHCGSATKAPQAEYVFKLWLAHGITSVRGVPLSRNDWTVREQERSAKNETVAPRIINYQRPPAKIRTPEEAREWVRNAPLKGIQGLKLGSYPPEIMQALLEEAKRLNMGSVAHLHQMGVAQMNALDAAEAGLQSVTHYYGHFEALLKDHVVQPWPTQMNYSDEQFRFGQVARLWDKIHPPGSPEWNAYLKKHLELGTVFDPTFTIYSASRDVMRARTAEWHDEYTMPSLWKYFQPSKKVHGSYWFYWTTEDEIAWRNFYQIWFQLVNDYKKMGGRVTTGADSGFIYDTYGFGYIEELELLQEAGFHPLEVIQCATYNSALTLHEPMNKPIDFGIIREGLLADMVIVPENPLANFKVLLGTGAVKLDEETDTVQRVGGVRWTIKDGIVYDAHQLLADVRAMVKAEKIPSAEAHSPASPDAPLTMDPTANSDVKSDSNAKKDVAEASGEQAPPNEIASSSDTVVLQPEAFLAWGRDKDGQWIRHAFPRDANASIPQFNKQLGWFRTGNQIHAFAKNPGAWETFDLESPWAEEALIMKDRVISVQTQDRLGVFTASQGKWIEILLEDQP